MSLSLLGRRMCQTNGDTLNIPEQLGDTMTFGVGSGIEEPPQCCRKSLISPHDLLSFALQQGHHAPNSFQTLLLVREFRDGSNVGNDPFESIGLAGGKYQA